MAVIIFIYYLIESVSLQKKHEFLFKVNFFYGIVLI